MVTALCHAVEWSIAPTRRSGHLAASDRPRRRCHPGATMTQHPTSTHPYADPGARPAPARRPRRPLVVALAVVGTVLLVVGLVLFEPWRLLTRSTIDEPLPAAAATRSSRCPRSRHAPGASSPPATPAARGPPRR